MMIYVLLHNYNYFLKLLKHYFNFELKAVMFCVRVIHFGFSLLYVADSGGYGNFTEVHSVTLTRHSGLIFTFYDKDKEVMFLLLSNIKKDSCLELYENN